jgi:hypothetical protein
VGGGGGVANRMHKSLHVLDKSTISKWHLYPIYKSVGRMCWYYRNCDIMKVSNLICLHKHLLFSLYRLFDVVLTVCMILHILNYGCVICAFHDIEEVHLMFLTSQIRAQQQTNNAAVCAW